MLLLADLSRPKIILNMSNKVTHLFLLHYVYNYDINFDSTLIKTIINYIPYIRMLANATHLPSQTKNIRLPSIRPIFFIRSNSKDRISQVQLIRLTTFHLLGLRSHGMPLTNVMSQIRNFTALLGDAALQLSTQFLHTIYSIWCFRGFRIQVQLYIIRWSGG